MKRYYYGNTIKAFLLASHDEIVGTLAANNQFELTLTQRDAWQEEITILDEALRGQDSSGHIYLEYSIPRLGSRVDAVITINDVVFVIEFKIGADTFLLSAIDQVWDYALDLKNFHQTSHNRLIAPILVATKARVGQTRLPFAKDRDGVFIPIRSLRDNLSGVIKDIVSQSHQSDSSFDDWDSGQYAPTPTIIEAAQALYAGHAVHEISRSDADAINLTLTSTCLEEIIQRSRSERRKTVCFVTGVPGAGKTLVGLDVATRHIDKDENLHSVFLSGNGPLVDVLREALARDKIRRELDNGNKLRIGPVRSEVKMFIQNVHHFRDECLVDIDRPPVEHVAIFDEAQRAWDFEQTSKFMRQKRRQHGFQQSEPEFLISCMNRHQDWSVVICLVGGGQEINTGEAGIREWIDSLNRSFPDWEIVISSQLSDSEYSVTESIESAMERQRVEIRDELHLGVSMRSFRAEHVSLFVKQLLDGEVENARKTYLQVHEKYPIVLARNLERAKAWVRSKARGGERYGVVASSSAHRLKPHAIDVRVNVDPIHWFLAPKEDVRSSYYLEDAATEFQVQGLELDWTCVTWDGDFRRTSAGWDHFSFVGDVWKRVRKAERQSYLKNAYRVLLTRARQGMVIVVPDGSDDDPTRHPDFYDDTYHFLRATGMEVIS